MSRKKTKPAASRSQRTAWPRRPSLHRQDLMAAAQALGTLLHVPAPRLGRRRGDRLGCAGQAVPARRPHGAAAQPIGVCQGRRGPRLLIEVPRLARLKGKLLLSKQVPLPFLCLRSQLLSVKLYERQTGVRWKEPHFHQAPHPGGPRTSARAGTAFRGLHTRVSFMRKIRGPLRFQTP